MGESTGWCFCFTRRQRISLIIGLTEGIRISVTAAVNTHRRLVGRLAGYDKAVSPIGRIIEGWEAKRLRLLIDNRGVIDGNGGDRLLGRTRVFQLEKDRPILPSALVLKKQVDAIKAGIIGLKRLRDVGIAAERVDSRCIAGVVVDTLQCGYPGSKKEISNKAYAKHDQD